MPEAGFGFRERMISHVDSPNRCEKKVAVSSDHTKAGSSESEVK